jgi:hypothetical protein
VRVKFPSGRAIDAPMLAGTYRVSGADPADILDYAEAKDATKDATTINATLTVTLARATCEEQRRTVAADASDVAATDVTRPLGLAWYVAYTRTTRKLRVACKATKAGAVMATLDEPAAAAAWPELEPVLAAMIAAR